MLILAIETTDKAGGVAILEGSRVIAELELDPSKRSAQSLAPGIDQVLRMADCRPADISLVAVADGPGSFTGLRVGVTTAKLFAYAVGADVLGVSSLEAIARQCEPAFPELWTAIDAQRDEVFAARFLSSNADRWIQDGPVHLMAISQWITRLSASTLASGPVLAKLQGRIPRHVPQAPGTDWSPRAGVIGRLAFEQYSAGKRASAFLLVPQYLRRSAAEEKKLAEPAN